MYKKVVIGFIFVLISSYVYAANECIMLTNYSSAAVIFDSLVSPGISYTVQPSHSVTLSQDHMVGACLNKKTCSVTLSPVDLHESLIINDLPRGAMIFYNGLNNYYVDKNAHIVCEK